MGEARSYDGIDYVPGRKFRVVAEGVRLVGWTAIQGGARGWSEALPVGAVVTCKGYGASMGSDPGYGIEFTSDAAQEAGAFHIELHPSDGGMWNFHPRTGILEALPEAEQDTEREMAAAKAAHDKMWADTLRRAQGKQ